MREAKSKKARSRPLTQAAIAAATCPAGKSWQPLWDAQQPGLVVRIYPTGKKVYAFSYRVPGGGRAAPRKWVRLGDVAAISLATAREAARIQAGEVAKGGDPAAARRAQKLQAWSRLEAALDRYEADLLGRKVVKRVDVLSLLRRELLKPLGNVDLAEVDLATLVRRVDEIKVDRPGTAHDFRRRAGVFLGWCAAQGLIAHNPLVGWRQPRQTRAERLAKADSIRSARALSDNEIPIFWRAAEAQGWPFGPYLQVLLLTGQRRTETALMRWHDLDLDGGVWTIPAADTKSGREHQVPLPPELVSILSPLPRLRAVPYVFPGRRGAVLSGWTKRLNAVHDITSAAGVERFTLHDLRRTMRTGLTALNVDQTVAEMMLNHAIGDELRQIYDKHGYPKKRQAAAARWARHVMGLVGQHETGKVIDIAGAR